MDEKQKHQFSEVAQSLMLDLVNEAMSAFGADAANSDLKPTMDVVKRVGKALHEKLVTPPISDKLDALLPEPSEEKLQELMYLAHMAGHAIYRELYAN